jgi:hypothetical protein
MDWMRVFRNKEKWRDPADRVGTHQVTVFVRTGRLFLSKARWIQPTPPCNVEVNTGGVKTAEEEDNLWLRYRRCNLQFSVHILECWQGDDEASGCGGSLGGKGSTGDGALRGLTASYLLRLAAELQVGLIRASVRPALDSTTNIQFMTGGLEGSQSKAGIPPHCPWIKSTAVCVIFVLGKLTLEKAFPPEHLLSPAIQHSKHPVVLPELLHQDQLVS